MYPTLIFNFTSKNWFQFSLDWPAQHICCWRCRLLTAILEMSHYLFNQIMLCFQNENVGGVSFVYKVRRALTSNAEYANYYSKLTIKLWPVSYEQFEEMTELGCMYVSHIPIIDVTVCSPANITSYFVIPVYSCLVRYTSWQIQRQSMNSLKMAVFQVVAPCSLVEVYASIIRAMSHRPDDGGGKDLWNVGKLLPDYTALQPRRQQSSYSPPWEPQILLNEQLIYTYT
jgi:hypothetical protein